MGSIGGTDDDSQGEKTSKQSYPEESDNLKQGMITDVKINLFDQEHFGFGRIDQDDLEQNSFLLSEHRTF